jgi:hypothetical protein
MNLASVLAYRLDRRRYVVLIELLRVLNIQFEDVLILRIVDLLNVKLLVSDSVELPVF